MMLKIAGGAICAGLLMSSTALAQTSGIRIGGDVRGNTTNDATQRAVGVGIGLLGAALSKRSEAASDGPLSVSGVVRRSVELTNCDSRNPTMVAACRLVPGSRQVTVQEIALSPVKSGDAEVAFVAMPTFSRSSGGDRPSETISMSFAALGSPPGRTPGCPPDRAAPDLVATGEIVPVEEGLGIVMRYEQGGSLRLGGVKFLDPAKPIARNLQTFANRYEVSVTRGSRTK